MCAWRGPARRATPTDHWARLTFPVPVVVRRVRLYNLPDGAPPRRSRVAAATVRLFADAAPPRHWRSGDTGPVSARRHRRGVPRGHRHVVQVTLDEVTGQVDGAPAAGLAEIEVQAKGADRPPTRTTARR